MIRLHSSLSETETLRIRTLLPTLLPTGGLAARHDRRESSSQERAGETRKVAAV